MNRQIVLLMNRLTAAFMFCMVLLMSDLAFANRLEQAANRSAQMLITIGQATSVIGIILGGIALNFGASQLGRILLMSGILGAVCVFGGPAVIDFVRGFFA